MDETLRKLQNGQITLEEAKKELTPYEDLGFAKVDHQRKQRQGFPEVIYGEGKTTEQLLAISRAMMEKNSDVLITRVDQEKAALFLQEESTFHYSAAARTLTSHKPDARIKHQEGYIAVLCAGTSDLPVAEEAAITAEFFGSEVRRFYDVGVAGIHRLFDHIEEIQGATCTVAVAGMEGALPSVVGGLLSHPLIAVPTSVGYGANFQGLSSLLSMLNACASGISVVNIDNGFGGAYNAVMIHQLAQSGKPIR